MHLQIVISIDLDEGVSVLFLNEEVMIEICDDSRFEQPRKTT